MPSWASPQKLSDISSPGQIFTTPLLASRCFLLCGASFAVNLRHVAAVEQTAAVMDDATRVPIPRRLGPQIKRAWMDYWLEADKKW
mgnify:CR=1 FL=1